MLIGTHCLTFPLVLLLDDSNGTRSVKKLTAIIPKESVKGHSLTCVIPKTSLQS